jgi:AcrR family transcriptional regulator
MNENSLPGSVVHLRDRLRHETRAAILAAAEQVFVDDGLERARMESIAARARVAVGTLYNYFEDREGLLVALVEARREALLHRLDSALAAGKGLPFEAALTGLLRALFDHWSTHHGLLAVLLQAEDTGLVAPGRGPLLDDVTRRVEKVLRRGRTQGKLRADAAGLQAAAVVGMVRGVLRRSVRRRSGAREEDWAGQVLEIFLRGAGR